MKMGLTSISHLSSSFVLLLLNGGVIAYYYSAAFVPRRNSGSSSSNPSAKLMTTTPHHRRGYQPTLFMAASSGPRGGIDNNDFDTGNLKVPDFELSSLKSSSFEFDPKSSFEFDPSSVKILPDNMKLPDVKIPDIPKIPDITIPDIDITSFASLDALRDKLGIPPLDVNNALVVVAGLAFLLAVAQKQAGIEEGRTEVIDKIIAGEINADEVRALHVRTCIKRL